MGNHYHLLLKTRKDNLSRALQWLGVSYSGYFNWRWSRSGHVFQGRFKSFIIQEETYLKQLILYIHRNPLRAKIVERLADYPWSSYPCLAYGRNCAGWLKRDKVLKLYGGDKKSFREAVQKYSEEEESLFENLREGLFLGGEEVFDRLKEKIKGIVHPKKTAEQKDGEEAYP